MADNAKPKLAMYWAVVVRRLRDLHRSTSTRTSWTWTQVFDLAFFPCIADFKIADVRGYHDGHIDLCLFNGAIRNSENEEMAHLLRQKSKVMVAFGSCAYEGCIPALSNLTSKEATLQRRLPRQPVDRQPRRHRCRRPRDRCPRASSTIPYFYHTVKSLDQVVDVDYYIPGCPPEPHQIWAVLEVVVAALTEGAPLPPKGSVVGAGQVAVCEECPLTEEREADHRLLPTLRDRAGTGPVSVGAGPGVPGPGHPQWLWRALPPGGHGLPRLLRAAARRGGPGGQDAVGHRLGHRRRRAAHATRPMLEQEIGAVDGHLGRSGRHLLPLQHGPFAAHVARKGTVMGRRSDNETHHHRPHHAPGGSRQASRSS